MKRLLFAVSLASVIALGPLASDQPAPVKTEVLPEQTVVTEHTATIKGKKVPYKATVGTIDIKGENGTVKGSMFYIAYIAATDQPNRPVTFCFNGGPGAASVWLHMGFLGPKRTFFTDEGYGEPPYKYIDNDYSLLDITDLVFIDPISTGYSRALTQDDAKQFHGVDEDAKSVAEFVQLWTTRNGRWDSPKYLLGESYGTTRAVAMTDYLHDDYGMYLNGLILISSILDYQTLDKADDGNDLPYILYLPSYAVTSWYHKKLSPEMQKKTVQQIKQEASQFAVGAYASALLQGDELEPAERQQILKKLSQYTGLSPDYLDRADLRVSYRKYIKDLLSDQTKVVGRFDTRITGVDTDPCGTYCDFDPSKEVIMGAIASTFNQYVRDELKWEKDGPYKVLTSVQPWNFADRATNKYLNLSNSLKISMSQNPYMKVFVANGYYDLATPIFGQEYTFNHLGLVPEIKKNITMRNYQSGHMMYTKKQSMEHLRDDLEHFYEQKTSRS